MIPYRTINFSSKNFLIPEATLQVISLRLVVGSSNEEVRA